MTGTPPYNTLENNQGDASRQNQGRNNDGTGSNAGNDETDKKKLKQLFHVLTLTEKKCSVVYSFFLVIQLVKVILITMQMFNFGYDRNNFSNVVNRGHLTLRHLLLENWDASWETLAYPPAQGELAVYTIDDLERGINFAVKGYYNAEEGAIGYFNRTEEDTMEIQVKYFDFPGFHDAEISEGVHIKDKTFPVDEGLSKQNVMYDYDIIKEFKAQQLKQPIKRLLSTELRFSIHSVRVFENVRRAQCLHVKGWVTFNDLDNNGQVIVNLETLTSRIKCERMNLTLTDLTLENTSEELGVALIVFCALSLFISGSATAFTVYYCLKTKAYMKMYLRLIKFWDIVVIFADSFALYATAWIVFEKKQSEWLVETLDHHTVLLAVGCLLAWIILLRFFKFHNKFHLLFSTLYRTFWNVMAYLLLVTVLFVGFWICGFVVLGPYHVKFRTPESAAETLFSMANGDEIYATFAILEYEKTGGDWVLWFFRFYIGTYISVFGIVVINLLIAIYTSAYQTITENQKKKEDVIKSKKPSVQPVETSIQELRENARL